MYEDLSDSETVLARFNRLMQDLIRGSIRSNTFRPWEVELLLDIQDCPLQALALRRALQRYQKAVQRQMEKGACRPPKFSEYLNAHVGLGRPDSAVEIHPA
jgi:hypothetical protein